MPHPDHEIVIDNLMSLTEEQLRNRMRTLLAQLDHTVAYTPVGKAADTAHHVKRILTGVYSR